MLNKNMTTLRVSEAPGAQDGPLLLEICVHSVQNRSEIVTRGFSRMLYKNIISPKVYKVPGALGDPGWTFSWSFKLISFRIGPKSLLGGFRGC